MNGTKIGVFSVSEGNASSDNETYALVVSNLISFKNDQMVKSGTQQSRWWLWISVNCTTLLPLMMPEFIFFSLFFRSFLTICLAGMIVAH